jgi:hypothetical protein
MRCVKWHCACSSRALRSAWKEGKTDKIVFQGRTDVGLAKEPSALGRGRRRRGALNLRRRGRARLAHAVCSVHLGGGVLAM